MPSSVRQVTARALATAMQLASQCMHWLGKQNILSWSGYFLIGSPQVTRFQNTLRSMSFSILTPPHA